MPKTTNKLKDFEQALDQLEQIIHKMEQDDTSLEEALKQFETGITLAKDCQQALNSAELKVQQLIEKNGLQQTLPFDENDA